MHRELGKQQGPDTVESLVAEAAATPHSERGIELLTQAIAMSPFDPILYYHRGRIAYNLTVRKTARRHYDMAVADLEKALLGRPRDTRISEALCLTLVQFTELFDVSWKKNSEREKQLLDEWLATEPDNVSALAILADWQSRYSTLEAVLATCDKGHKLDRARPEFLLFAGWHTISTASLDRPSSTSPRRSSYSPNPTRTLTRWDVSICVPGALSLITGWERTTWRKGTATRLQSWREGGMDLLRLGRTDQSLLQCGRFSGSFAVV